MIQAVIFDFGNVICAFDNDVFLRNLICHTDRRFDDLKMAIYASDLPARYETGRISSEDFFREAARRGNLSVSREDFFKAFTGIFTPIPSTFRLIRQLKERYKIGLLSNTNEWHFEHHIRAVDVFPLFDAVTLSYRVKAMKPAEEIYRDSLQKIGLPPGLLSSGISAFDSRYQAADSADVDGDGVADLMLGIDGTLRFFRGGERR